MRQPTDPTCTVVICDAAAAIRRALRMVLTPHAQIEIVGEAGDGREAIELVRSARPDVLLLDVSMPVMDGIEAVPHVIAASPHTTVLMMSALGSAETKARALAAGAAAFLEKGTSVGALVEQILQVRRGAEPNSGPGE